MRSVCRLVLFVAATAAGAACGGGPYTYVPATNTSAMIAGRPASYYAIPPEAPRGDLRVATFGFADVAPASDESVRLRSIHVRMIVANNATAPWTVDTREQRLTLPGSGESRAAYASVNQGAPPIIDVPPGQARTIDLFYPLPAAYRDADKLPAFDIAATVRTDTQAVTERTPFERLEIADGGYDGYAYYGPYWYDPYYPYYYPGRPWGGFGFTYVSPVIIHGHGRHVHGAPPPAFHGGPPPGGHPHGGGGHRR